eukprot:TRINITY_DN664_c3_g1_i1.p1 TRINITY_DN664_c3_g1~~TRINITY_DN664_c3_g1_i1.p1  ORF type:complete len:724 (+),score=136.42 TRINITY_DN664_c3_g1_i1:47-2173(+)
MSFTTTTTTTTTTAATTTSQTTERYSNGTSEGGEKRWVRTSLPFGPVPVPRHSHLSFATKDRYLFIFGGVFAGEKSEDADMISRFDVVSLRWSRIPTKGTSPPLENRVPWTMCFGRRNHSDSGRVFVLVPSWKSKGKTHLYTKLPLRVVESCELFVLDVETLTWTSSKTPAFVPSPTATSTPKEAAQFELDKTFTLSSLSLYLNALVYVPHYDRLVVVGGAAPDGNFCGTMSKLDLAGPRKNQWSVHSLPSTPRSFARVSHTAFANDSGTFFVTHGASQVLQPRDTTGGLSGRNLVTCYSTLYATHGDNYVADRTLSFNPDNQVRDPAAVYANGNLFIFGGRLFSANSSTPSFSNKLLVLNTSKSEFQNYTVKVLEHSPGPRANSSLTLIGDRLYLFGGRDQNDKFFGDVRILQLADGDLNLPPPTRNVIAEPLKEGYFNFLADAKNKNNVSKFVPAKIVDVRGNWVKIKHGSFTNDYTYANWVHTRFESNRFQSLALPYPGVVGKPTILTWRPFSEFASVEEIISTPSADTTTPATGDAVGSPSDSLKSRAKVEETEKGKEKDTSASPSPSPFPTDSGPLPNPESSPELLSSLPSPTLPLRNSYESESTSETSSSNALSARRIDMSPSGSASLKRSMKGVSAGLDDSGSISSSSSLALPSPFPAHPPPPPPPTSSTTNTTPSSPTRAITTATNDGTAASAQSDAVGF